MRNTLAISTLLFLALFASNASAAAVVEIFNYTIFDKDGNLAAEGNFDPLSDCWGSGGTSVHRIYRNITAGDWYQLRVNVGNTATGAFDNEDSAEMVIPATLDSFGNQIGYYEWWTGENTGPLKNFTEYLVSAGNQIVLSPGENKTLIQYPNVTKYVDGNFTFVLEIDGITTTCQKAQIGVHSDEYFKVELVKRGKGIYGSDVYSNLTNFNDGNYYSSTDKNWTLYMNFTVRNLGTFDSDVRYSLQCNFPYSNGTHVLPAPQGCAAPVPSTGTIKVPVNGEYNFSCLMNNATNGTGRNFLYPGYCGGIVICDLSVSNSTFEYSVYKQDFYDVLGQTPCPPPIVKWSPYFTSPTVASLYVVPGVEFNLSTSLWNYFQFGNYTTDHNLNLSSLVMDSAFKTLYANWKWVLPQGPINTLNVSTSDGFQKLIDTNISANVPPATEPAHYFMELRPSKSLADRAHANGQWSVNQPCGSGWWISDFYDNVSLCTVEVVVTLTRLIYIDGFNRVTKYVSPGAVFTFPYGVYNPFSAPFDFVQTYLATRPSPITLNFDPNPMNVPRAFSFAPGNKNGTLTVTVPINTPLRKFTFLINTTSLSAPSIWDSGILELIVINKDVEIVSINKTPSKFIYDPAEDRRVDLKAVIKNNFGEPENATLNLSVLSPEYEVHYIACGGSNITLDGFETKTIDCGAHVNLTETTNENIAVSGSLGLLTGTDGRPENNFKVEIISVVSREQEPVTVPENNPLAFILLLLIALIAVKRHKKNQVERHGIE